MMLKSRKISKCSSNGKNCGLGVGSRGNKRSISGKRKKRKKGRDKRSASSIIQLRHLEWSEAHA